MNETTGKFARWVVRVCEPHVTEYTFMARNERVQASKFECWLVSQDPTQYIMGLVPFSFQNRAAATQAMNHFKEGTVWEVKCPSFDKRARPDFNGSPMKRVLLLEKPTKVRAIPPVEMECYRFPSSYVHPPLTLADIVKLRDVVSTNQSRAVDFTAKVVKVGDERQVIAKGEATCVRDVEIIDDSTLASGKGAKCTVTAWGAASKTVAKVPLDSGVTCLNFTAQKSEDGQIKISMNAHAKLQRDGARVEALSAMEFKQDDLEAVTRVWQPSSKSISVEGDAIYTCAAAMAAAQSLTGPGGGSDDVLFQVNRAQLEVPTAREHLFTIDGARLFIRGASLRDWSGMVEVDIVQAAVPRVFDMESKEDLEVALERGFPLEPKKCRVNVRGVRRFDRQGTARFYVAQVADCPNTTPISTTATRSLLGVCDVQCDGIVPAPVSAIYQCPMLGLAVARSDGKKLGCFRALCLARGTQKSKCSKIDGTAGQQEAYRVESANATCLISGGAVDLRGYCNIEGLLDFKLDTEVALLLVSSIRSSSGGNPVVTLDFMEKVLTKDVDAVLSVIQTESEMALQAAIVEKRSSDFTSPGSARKCRRLTAEPSTPGRSSREGERAARVAGGD